MGLATVIQKYKRKTKQIRILVLGLDNAGKSTLIDAFTRQTKDLLSEAPKIAPTMGFSIRTIPYKRNELVYSLTFWDVGGQESLRPYWITYHDNRVDALLWVIDASEVSRLGESIQWMQEQLSQGLETRLHVILNKTDLIDETPDDLNSLHGFVRQIHRVSAKTGVGVRECLDAIVTDCHQINS